ncbi:Hypothetical protein HVR_LOCUS688 [uncultured virus]|nr:Hypothetical protein HVR_LOCUS688 [uncultured virus]
MADTTRTPLKSTGTSPKSINSEKKKYVTVANLINKNHKELMNRLDKLEQTAMMRLIKKNHVEVMRRLNKLEKLFVENSPEVSDDEFSANKEETLSTLSGLLVELPISREDEPSDDPDGDSEHDPTVTKESLDADLEDILLMYERQKDREMSKGLTITKRVKRRKQMTTEIDRSIIPGASYYVYEGATTKNSPIACTPGGMSEGSKTVTFYTADGDIITTIDHQQQFLIVRAKLDLNAPKPKAASYKKIWWPAFELGWGMTKGVPGYAVLFHDKNGNRFAWERISSEDADISTLTEVDLSSAVEEEADYSRKRTQAGERSWCVIC